MRRIAWITATAAAVLLAGGCGDSDDDPGESPFPGTSATGNAQQQTGSVEGTWRSGDTSDLRILQIRGTNVDLAGGGTVCKGALTEGITTVDLVCPDGSTDRNRGTITVAADGGSLNIDWGSGSAETYTKVDAPDGIPTDGLDVPSGGGPPTDWSPPPPRTSEMG